MENTASVWEDPQCPFRVEWEPDELNRMRMTVMDAFYALPRGGIEVGGVLLGKVEGKVMRIESFAPMECEHLTGPSFVLSPKDEAALEMQLTGLDGQVLGWFHSHTRSELHFSPRDVEVHNRFFPKASHIGMVLRPANSQPPQANYFFRGPRAEIIGGKTTFLVKPVEAATAPVPMAAQAAIEKPVEPVAAPQAAMVLPVFLRGPEPKPEAKKSFLWLLTLLLILSIVAFAFFTRGLWMPK